jgi:hypothetical protein
MSSQPCRAAGFLTPEAWKENSQGLSEQSERNPWSGVKEKPHPGRVRGAYCTPTSIFSHA